MSHPDYSRRYRIRKVWGWAGILEDILGLLLNKAAGAGSYLRDPDQTSMEDWYFYLSKEPGMIVPCIANMQLFLCLRSYQPI